MIIGAPGTGKSVLARRVGELTGLPVIHLDAELWQPGWVLTPKDQELEALERMVAGDRWIIDGNWANTQEIRLRRADTVIHLDLPRRIYFTRIVKRSIMYRGRSRPDMAVGCPERLDWAFVSFTWRFPRRGHPRNLERIAAHGTHAQIITLRTRREIDAFLATLAAQVQA
jgi:adenylate kinase family enzyme